MSRVRQFLIVFACWTFAGLFFTAQNTLGNAFHGYPISFTRTLGIYMTCAYIWLLFTPLIVALSRRFRLAAPNVVSSAAVHILASFAFMFASLTIFTLITPYTVGGEMARRAFSTRLSGLIASEMHLEMLRYWGVVAVEHVVRSYRQAREREVAESQLRAELAESKLEVLKRQLHPHFLFNTLNSISVLMFENVDQANRMLLRLSDLLRAGLTTDSPHEVSLERELAFLDRYLEIERIRFGERLTIDVDVDPSTLGARVPNLLLQPLVENAIRYGVATVDRPGTIAIRAQRHGSELHIEVRDDGPGMARDAKRGVGLSNTEARLRHLYGTAQRLELTTPGNGGVLVSIAIPFRGAEA